jgi:VanZ family protein
MAWVPLFLGLTVISIESTALMSGANTSRWLLELCHGLWGQTDGATFAESHLFLRKLGHFSGYGILALMFRRGWYSSVRSFSLSSRSQLRLAAAGLAVASTSGVACIDEWHQSFLPSRTSSFHDVIIDTCGAILFNTVLLVVLARRRRALVGESKPWLGAKARG